MTGWNGQMMNGEYRIQFETTHKDLYKMVEKACQMAMDEEGKRQPRRTYTCSVSPNVANYNWQNEIQNG